MWVMVKFAVLLPIHKIPSMILEGYRISALGRIHVMLAKKTVTLDTDRKVSVINFMQT